MLVVKCGLWIDCKPASGVAAAVGSGTRVLSRGHAVAMLWPWASPASPLPCRVSWTVSLFAL